MLINRLNHPLFHDTAWVWTVNTNLSFEPIIKYLFGCKGTNFSTKLQIFLALFFCLRRSMRIMGRFLLYKDENRETEVFDLKNVDCK